MHRSSFAAVLVSVALLGCRSETSLEAAPPDVAIRILSPEYGSFHGEGPVTVRGHVSTPAATVTVEDQVVPVGPDGIFEVDLPITHDYLNIDAKAELLGVKARDRLPVFRGREPSETWPGGVTLRVTPPLLTIIGEALGAQFDETGWSESLGDLLPPLAFQGIELTPVGVSHDPTVVELIPVEGGVDVALSLRHLTMDYVTTIDLFGIPLEVPVAFGYEEVAVGVMATPAVDADGMVTLELGEADVVLGEPIVEVFLLDAAFLEPTLVQLAGFVEPIVELVLGLAVGAVGEIPLGARSPSRPT